MEEEKPLVWIRKTWAELKQVRILPHYFKLPVKDPHPGAIRGNKILTIHQLKHAVKQGHLPTNHERVIAGRAARMHFSIAEYKRKFCV